MRKIKILSITLAFVLSVGLVACSSAPAAPMFDEVLPWSEKSSGGCSEILTYDFARYLTGVTVNPDFVREGEDADNGYKLTENGRLTYTIEEGKSVSYADGVVTKTNDSAHTLITSELTVTYKTNLTLVPNTAVRNLYAGKTDTITSYSVLDRYTLASLFTYKSTEIEAQSDIDTMSYILTADYTGDFTGSRSAVLEDKSGTKTSSIKKGKYYDSESVYMLVRAMRTVKGGDSRGFNMALPYNDLLEDKKLSPRPMVQNTAADTVQLNLKDNVLGFFKIPAAEAENDEGESLGLKAYKTALKLNVDKSGPAINLYYSAYPTINSSKQGILFAANKVLVAFDYPNHDRASNAVYNQKYELTDYSNKNYL